MIFILSFYCSCPNGLVTFIMAPSHPLATGVAMYPALFLKNRPFFLLLFYSIPLHPAFRISQVLLEAKDGESIISANNIRQMWEMMEKIDNISALIPLADQDYDYGGCKVNWRLRRRESCTSSFCFYNYLQFSTRPDRNHKINQYTALALNSHN